jgi:hypothetical protein
MAPKRYRPAKEGDAGTSKSSDKEELVKARATKRAERVKARYEEAEKHKEIVRGVVSASVSRRKTYRNVHIAGKRVLSQRGISKGYRKIRSGDEDSRP